MDGIIRIIIMGLSITADPDTGRVVSADPTSPVTLFDLAQAGELATKFGGSKTYGHVSYYLLPAVLESATVRPVRRAARGRW